MTGPTNPARAAESSDDDRGSAFFRSPGRRWWLIALCAVIGGAGAFAIAVVQPDEYTASASLLFRATGFGQSSTTGPSLAGSRDPTRDAATNVTLVSLRVVAERAAKVLGGGL